jgi:hypothetical protein
MDRLIIASENIAIKYNLVNEEFTKKYIIDEQLFAIII